MVGRSIVALGIIGSLAFAGASYAQNSTGAATPVKPPAQQASQSDRTFLKKAIQSDLAEIQIGKLAQQKGKKTDVKQFGATLQQDHTANLQQANRLAKELGMTPPKQPTEKQRAEYKRLGKLSGTQFHAQFAQAMVKDHQKAIGQFQAEAKNTGVVADFAHSSLGVLKSHLGTAQALIANRAKP